MMDAAKVADLVLLMIDGSFGLEMETFEFLNLLQVSGLVTLLLSASQAVIVCHTDCCPVFCQFTCYNCWTTCSAVFPMQQSKQRSTLRC
jgi:hypothetical protein